MPFKTYAFIASILLFGLPAIIGCRQASERYGDANCVHASTMAVAFSDHLPHGLPDNEIAAFEQEKNESDSPKTYHLSCGLILKITDGNIQIVDASENVLITNNHLIRQRDEHGDCPSEGFLNVVSKGIYFTIEQQNCGGWYFINEYITFKYLKSVKKVQLYKFGLSYDDRRNPDKPPRERVLTEKQFGRRYFENVYPDSLYLLLR